MCAIKPSPIQDLGSDRLLGGQLLVFYPSTDHETYLGEKKEQNIARIFSQTFLVSSFIERKAKKNIKPMIVVSSNHHGSPNK